MGYNFVSRLLRTQFNFLRGETPKMGKVVKSRRLFSARFIESFLTVLPYRLNIEGVAISKESTVTWKLKISENEKKFKTSFPIFHLFKCSILAIFIGRSID